MSLESWRKRPRRVLDDPAAMRAFAHPVRLALHELLMRAGATTAADAAREVDELLARAEQADRELAARREGATYAGDPDPYKKPRDADDEDDDDA